MHFQVVVTLKEFVEHVLYPEVRIIHIAQSVSQHCRLNLKICLSRHTNLCFCVCRQRAFNYDARCVGLTQGGRSALADKKLLGFVKDQTRVRVGTGIETYLRCKAMMENWRSDSCPE